MKLGAKKKILYIYIIINKKPTHTKAFSLHVSPPDASKIPTKEDLLGPTALIFTAYYN